VTRTLQESLHWAVDGTASFLGAVAELDASGFDAPSLLPGWNRRQVVSHVAANADALANLVSWARTGQPCPMYASPEARAEGIARGLSMEVADLGSWLVESACALESAWDDLDPPQWSAVVVTAQGREVPASEIPWLRAREVWVHLVDLDVGAGFDDVPTGFLRALRTDVLAKRALVPTIVAPLPDELAWLTGRPHRIADAPTLPPWL
jgi:maleylpyruvate isomerase